MKILAIDTAAWKCSVALWEDGHELAFQEQDSERDQAALLPQFVKDVMGQHTIDHLIVNVGPGSFTGIRVGLAFAKGFAMGLNLPLKGIDSFTATYVSLDSPSDILILIEARRQDVFGQRFLNGISGSPQSLTREALTEILSAQNPPLVAGSGVHFLEGLSYREVHSRWHGAQSLAHTFFKDPTLAAEPLPFYIREPDVTYSRESCASSL
ncbi:MAG: tRNA (adenosine(37)-N6)-threonylcarbamoyltransferase complex dimerization subunit type 1 TsaB [Alphaproteobacteria bacterium 41-28]|nr:MAG: tRNA (adenosine(37)-N6)-threonylcarbamoyltransferase complex dimerization subunit type 1 TsaB [Alphaproteobacteria bacterium 41-28]